MTYDKAAGLWPRPALSWYSPCSIAGVIRPTKRLNTPPHHGALETLKGPLNISDGLGIIILNRLQALKGALEEEQLSLLSLQCGPYYACYVQQSHGFEPGDDTGSILVQYKRDRARITRSGYPVLSIKCDPENFEFYTVLIPISVRFMIL